MNTAALITELSALVKSHIVFAEQLKSLSDKELNYRIDSASWSALECLEHLNRYGDFYLPEIEKKMNESKLTASGEFKSGWLGNYFALSMLPKEKLNKMKTFKKMNPMHASLSREVLVTFIQQQQKFLWLLDHAQRVDLTKVKTAISITNLIKFRLGDTFRFVIYHQVRHIKQAKNVLRDAEVEKVPDTGNGFLLSAV